MSEAPIIVTGRLYADLVMTGLPRLPEPGREHYASGMLVAPGGGVFITAAHLQALGRNPLMAAACGDDPISQAILARLVERGFAQDLIEHFAGGPQLTVAMAVDQDRAFATHRAGPSVPAALRGALRAGRVRHLHIAELATLLDAPWLIEAAHAADATVSLDVAWDDDAFADPRALELAMGADLLFPNRDEAAALTRATGAGPSVWLDRLAARGAIVALKLDRDGAMLRTGGLTVTGAALPAQVIDATGAGDAFAAGFLDAWLDGAPPAEALARALACGALAVSVPGGAEKPPAKASVLARAWEARIETIGNVHPERRARRSSHG